MVESVFGRRTTHVALYDALSGHGFLVMGGSSSSWRGGALRRDTGDSGAGGDDGGGSGMADEARDVQLEFEQYLAGLLESI